MVLQRIELTLFSLGVFSMSDSANATCPAVSLLVDVPCRKCAKSRVSVPSR